MKRWNNRTEKAIPPRIGGRSLAGLLALTVLTLGLCSTATADPAKVSPQLRIEGSSTPAKAIATVGFGITKKNVTDSTRDWLDTNLVVKAVRHRLSSLETCYSKSLRRSRSNRGFLVYDVLVPDSGKIQVVKDMGTIDDPELEACFERHLNSMEWPRPHLGINSFHIPFILGSTDTASN